MSIAQGSLGACADFALAEAYGGAGQAPQRLLLWSCGGSGTAARAARASSTRPWASSTRGRAQDFEPRGRQTFTSFSDTSGNRSPGNSRRRTRVHREPRDLRAPA
jgi:hypothetical protein